MKIKSYWSGETPVLIKSLLYVFLIVGGWGILNSYDWEIGYILKQTFIIWFTGILSYYLASGFDGCKKSSK